MQRTKHWLAINTENCNCLFWLLLKRKLAQIKPTKMICHRIYPTLTWDMAGVAALFNVSLRRPFLCMSVTASFMHRFTCPAWRMHYFDENEAFSSSPQLERGIFCVLTAVFVEANDPESLNLWGRRTVQPAAWRKLFTLTKTLILIKMSEKQSFYLSLSSHGEELSCQRCGSEQWSWK